MIDQRPKPASDRAIKYMLDLAETREYSDEVSKLPPAWQELFHTIIADAPGPFAQTDVSKFIDLLKTCPQAPTQSKAFGDPTRQPGEQPQWSLSGGGITHTPKQELEDGMYKGPQPNEHIYKVYRTQKQIQVAKRLMVHEPDCGGCNNDDPCDPPYMATAEFKYEGKAPLKFLKPDMRLSMKDALEFGKIYGQCVVCGRTLTNELSIHLGIGPICGNREFGGEFQFMLKQAEVEVTK
jgi:hypothetical protein